jgi:hypothetical protein
MRSRSPALLGAFSMPALAYFLGASVALQLLRPDYDWILDPLSFYLIGPGSGWLILGFFALAVGIVGVALGLHASVRVTPLGRAALWLFVIAALATAMVALVQTDLPGGPNPTLHGMLHFAAASVAFLGITVAMLLQAWCLRADPYWQRYFRKAFALAILTFVSLAVYALWRALPRGISEKFVILLIVLWLLLASRWLMQTRLASPKTDPA